MRCPSCKMREMRPWEGPVGAMGISVLGRGEHCNPCDETIFTHAEMVRQSEEAAAGLVERGIRTWKEFRFVRRVADLPANDVAAMLDVTPETISRWEHGKLPIPKLAAFA